MANCLMKLKNLSREKKRLIKLMRLINFGRIEHLVFRNGQPVFDPVPRFICKIKTQIKHNQKPVINKDDFTLKKEIWELFKNMTLISNGTILSIEIQYGLPVRIDVERNPANLLEQV